MKLFLAFAIVAFVGAAVEGRAIRDLKSTLITKGNDLIKKAEEAITKLEADKKTHEVSIVKHEEAAIKKLISELEAATETSKITHIEHQLSQAEHKLQFELQKIAHGTHTNPGHHHVPTDPIHHPHIPAKRDLKSTLITKGNDLIKKAEEAITKLEADKKTHEVSIVKHEEAAIKKLISELEAATETSKITHIEHQLSQAEHKLQFELQKIAHGTHTNPGHHVPHDPTHPHGHIPAKRDLKSTLITKSKDLLTKADEAIKKLQAEHKTHEVSIIKSEESAIKKLVADLEAATETEKITKIEHELSRAEHKLQHELDRVGHVHTTHPTDPHHHVPHQPHIPAKRDLKSTLITKGNDLIKKAEEAIVKLEADKKTHEVSIVKHEEAAIKKLISELEAATETSKITHIEHQLSQAEHKLQFELQKIAHGTHTNPGHHHIPTHGSIPA